MIIYNCVLKFILYIWYTIGLLYYKCIRGSRTLFVFSGDDSKFCLALYFVVIYTFLHVFSQIYIYLEI